MEMSFFFPLHFLSGYYAFIRKPWFFEWVFLNWHTMFVFIYGIIIWNMYAMYDGEIRILSNPSSNTIMSICWGPFEYDSFTQSLYRTLFGVNVSISFSWLFSAMLRLYTKEWGSLVFLECFCVRKEQKAVWG
jgi:hypothetical protein